MGRQTKKQRDRKAQQKRTVTTPEGVEVVQPRSQFPKGAKKPLRPPTPHRERDQRHSGTVPPAAAVGEFFKNMAASAGKVTPEQREEASRRLKAVLDMLQVKPQPILQQLKDIGVPYTTVHNVRGNPQYDTVVMKVTDLEEADRRIAGRGTLYDQMYKEGQ